MATRRTGWGLLACTLVLAWEGGALADSVSARTGTDKGPRGKIAGANSSYFLWSNVTGPTAVGPNQETRLTGRTSAGMFYNIATPIPTAAGIGLDFGAVTYPDVGGPGAVIVGKASVAKPDAPSGYQLGVDDSNVRIPDTSRYYQAISYGSVFRQGDTVGASANLYNRATGSAASITYDPGLLSAPSQGYYTLDYLDDQGVRQDAYEVSAAFQKSLPGNFEAVEYMVYDSRIGTVDPSNVGDPSGTLWELRITANGDLDSKSDLSVDFMLNPLATIAGGGSANLLTDASGVPIDPATIDAAILNAFTVGDGTATLGPTPLFPLGTEYWVSSPIYYGFADGAGLEGTALPEPAAWALMLVGLGGLGAAVRSRRRAARANSG